MTDPKLPAPTALSVERIEARVAASNMLQWLNFGVSFEEEQLRYHLGFAERHIGNEFARALQGGVVSGFLQAAAEAELIGRSDEPLTIKTISVHCDFLRPAKAKDMQGEARLVHRGRRIAFFEATGWHDDPERPVAKANIAIRLL